MLPVPSSRWKTLASAAVVLIGLGDCQDPASLEKLPASATEVTAGEGDARAVTLKLMQSRSMPGRSSHARVLAGALTFAGFLAVPAAHAQIRGGGGMSTDRVASPAVVASWRAHDNYADGSSTTLLVLWRGMPGWFAARSGSSGGGHSSGGGGSYQYFTYGTRTFTMEFDDDKKIVKMVNQEISLKDANVILVDFVDSAAGPTIVGHRWVEPGPPAPPLVAGATEDPIAGVIRRSPELYEYLRCDLTVPDPLMNAMMPIICGMMRGERILPPGLNPR